MDNSTELHFARNLAHMIDAATPYRSRDMTLLGGAAIRRKGPRFTHWASLLALSLIVALVALAQ